MHDALIAVSIVAGSLYIIATPFFLGGKWGRKRDNGYWDAVQRADDMELDSYKAFTSLHETTLLDYLVLIACGPISWAFFLLRMTCGISYFLIKRYLDPGNSSSSIIDLLAHKDNARIHERREAELSKMVHCDKCSEVHKRGEPCETTSAMLHRLSSSKPRKKRRRIVKKVVEVLAPVHPVPPKTRLVDLQ